MTEERCDACGAVGRVVTLRLIPGGGVEALCAQCKTAWDDDLRRCLKRLMEYVDRKARMAR